MQTLRDVERDHILAALEHTDWRADAACALLEITYAELYLRCKRHGFDGVSHWRASREGTAKPNKTFLGDPRERSVEGNPPCPLCKSSRMLRADPDHPKLAICTRLKCMYERTRLKSQAQRSLVIVEREDRSA